MRLDILRLFFDPLCPACSRFVGAARLLRRMRRRAGNPGPPYCQSCGIPISHEVFVESATGTAAFFCSFFRPALRRPVAQAVRRGKYGPVPWIFGRLGKLLVPLLRAAGPAWVVPVPCTPSTWKTRGFSPTMQLCRSACRELARVACRRCACPPRWALSPGIFAG